MLIKFYLVTAVKIVNFYFTATFPEMSDGQNLDVDSQTAKRANAVAHVYCYSVEMVLLDQSLLLQTELYYR